MDIITTNIDKIIEEIIKLKKEQILNRLRIKYKGNNKIKTKKILAGIDVFQSSKIKNSKPSFESKNNHIKKL